MALVCFSPESSDQAGAVPPSMAAEAYLNFHLPGVIMAFLVFGYVSRILYEFLLVNSRNILVVGAYAFLVIFVFKFTNSDFVINMGQLVARAAPVLIAMIMVSGGMIKRNATPRDTRLEPLPANALVGTPLPSLRR